MVASANIRTANANDAARLKHCMVSAYAPYLERMGSARLPPMDVDYATEIENFPCWVVDRAGDILGGLIMVFTRDSASIANIAVDPSAQGQGVGGMLMRFAESTAKEKGFTRLQLTTHALLNENLSLYSHLGWQETGREADRVYLHKAL